MAKNEHNSLREEIDNKKTDFTTDSLSLSISELVSLYKDDEIIIQPEYQRLFRWSHQQKSNLIESLLLGIPIPSIFVYQNEDGIWELVDGLQRVSTILQFLGELKGYDQLVLTKTKYIPSLANYSFNGKAKNSITR